MPPTTAQIISGRDIADEIRAELEGEVQALKAESGVTPGLATVLERLDPDRRLDLDALSEAVASGSGSLSHAEKRLLFMREAFGELRPADAEGAPR